MTSRITGRTATGRRTLWRWAADTVWAHASTGRTLPIRPATVRIRTRQELAALHTNPNIHQIGHARPGFDPDTDRPAYYVTVYYADTAHPIRSPRAAKARRAAARAAKRLAAVGGTAAAIVAAGWTVQAVWGEQIAAALRLAAGAALTVLLVTVGALIVRSFTVGHACPGLHCPSCNGH
jgi:hypothetical protein